MSSEAIALQKKRRKVDLFPYAISAPALLLLVAGMLYPILWAVYYSFTSKSIGTPATFVGLNNYIALLKDASYLGALKNTTVFTVGAIAGKVFFGMIIALILNANIKFRNALRTFFLLPWTMPGIVAIYTWMWLYTGNGGILNNILLKYGLIESAIGWLTTKGMAMVSLIIVNVWRGIPFIAISVLSGLQTIPGELYESASIDGAGAIKSFRHITWPLVKPVVMVSTLISTIWTLNDFENVWILTGGGPGKATYTVPIAAYKYTFGGSVKPEVGMSCAASLILVPVLLVIMIPILNNMIGNTGLKETRKQRKEKRIEKQQMAIKKAGV